MKKLSILLVIGLLPILVFGQQYWDDIVVPMKVNDVLETSSTVWMATDGGVVSVDKQTKAVSRFTKAKDGLPSNSVEGIAMDNSGNLWIGTYTMRLAKYDGSTWTSISYPASFPNLTTHSLRIDQNDVIWAGTSAGLVKYDGTNWELFNSSNTGVSFFNDAWNIVFDQQGNLFTISSTVIKFDGTNWSDISIGTPVSSYGGAHMEMLDNGSLMFGNLQGNLVAFYDTAWTIYSTSNGDFPTPGISEMAQNNNGDIFIAVKGSGIYKLQGSVWSKETLPMSTIDETDVSSMFFDNNDNLWLANSNEFVAMESSANDYININTSPLKSNEIAKVIHNNSDVYVLNGSILSHYNSNAGWSDIATPLVITPLNHTLTNMVVTSNGEYYISSNFGELYHWNGQAWSTYTNSNSPLPIALIKDMVWVEEDQSLWMATSDGVIKLKNQQWAIYSSANTTLSKDRANHIQSKDGNIYVAIDEWVYRYDGTTWTDLSAVSPDYITGLYVDQSNNIWTGHWNGDIKKYENGTWSTVSTLQNTKVSSIVEDQNNDIYFGTEDEGLIKYDGTNWTYFTEANSKLSHNTINDLSIDTNNELWISTIQGVSIYSPAGTVSDEEVVIEDDVMSMKVFPNPIVEQATIEFTLNNNENIRLGIYDMNGRLVQSIIQNETRPQGEFRINFSKGELSSGLYSINLQTEHSIQSVKILIL